MSTGAETGRGEMDRGVEVAKQTLFCLTGDLDARVVSVASEVVFGVGISLYKAKLEAKSRRRAIRESTQVKMRNRLLVTRMSTR